MRGKSLSKGSKATSKRRTNGKLSAELANFASKRDNFKASQNSLRGRNVGHYKTLSDFDIESYLNQLEVLKRTSAGRIRGSSGDSKRYNEFPVTNFLKGPISQLSQRLLNLERQAATLDSRVSKKISKSPSRKKAIERIKETLFKDYAGGNKTYRSSSRKATLSPTRTKTISKASSKGRSKKPFEHSYRVPIPSKRAACKDKHESVLTKYSQMMKSKNYTFKKSIIDTITEEDRTSSQRHVLNTQVDLAGLMLKKKDGGFLFSKIHRAQIEKGMAALTSREQSARIAHNRNTGSISSRGSMHKHKKVKK